MFVVTLRQVIGNIDILMKDLCNCQRNMDGVSSKHNNREPNVGLTRTLV